MSDVKIKRHYKSLPAVSKPYLLITDNRGREVAKVIREQDGNVFWCNRTFLKNADFNKTLLAAFEFVKNKIASVNKEDV